MLASRCGPKFKETLGPAVKNVFVPRWLKLKTVAPKTRSSAVTFPTALPFLPREARFRCFCLSVNGLVRANSPLDFDTTSPASFGSLAQSAIFLCGAAESFACWASLAVCVQAHS